MEKELAKSRGIELMKRSKIAIRWPLCNAVKASSLGFSMCRMRNALPQELQ